MDLYYWLYNGYIIMDFACAHVGQTFRRPTTDDTHTDPRAVIHTGLWKSSLYKPDFVHVNILNQARPI